MIPLLSASELMSQSWQFFTARWKPLLKRASWFLLVLFLYIILAIPAMMKQQWAAYAIVLVLYVFGIVIALNHISLYLLKETSINPSSPKLARRAVDLLGPALWIIILSFVVFCVAGIAFVLPAIWLMVSCSFAHLFLLEHDIRGVAALKASYNLVKGRWWSVLWRLVAPMVVMVLAIWVLSILLWIVVGIIAGGSLLGVFMMLGTGTSAGANIVGGFGGVMTLIFVSIIGSLLQLATLFVALCYPLIVRTKLFQSLKQSASPAQKV